VKIRYTRRALFDLAEIHDYIAYNDLGREIQVLSVIHSARSWPTTL
jgi:plasmid stabilization system protein ParE